MSEAQEITEPRLEPSEFAAAFQEHSRLLWCVAAGVLGAPDEAEDVLQEAAMIALQKLDQFRPGSNFGAWMTRTVQLVALNHRRKRRRPAAYRQSSDEELELLARQPAAEEPTLSALGEVLDGERHFDDELLRALESVPETARSCLLLRTMLELSYAEIAVLVAIPEGTAMSHVHRAREILRERLAGRSGRSGSSVEGGAS